jgi:hypothetical protein
MKTYEVISLILSKNYSELVNNNQDKYNVIRKIYDKCKKSSAEDIQFTTYEQAIINKIKKSPDYLSEIDSEIDWIQYKLKKITQMASFFYDFNIDNLSLAYHNRTYSDLRAMIWSYCRDKIEYHLISSTKFNSLLAGHFKRQRSTVFNAYKNCRTKIENDYLEFKCKLDNKLNF